MFIKSRNKNKNEITKTNLDQIKNENRTKNFIITNSIVTLIFKIPEIAATTYYVVFNFGDISNDQFKYYLVTTANFGILNEVFDFVFCLNGVFQFILFYNFNKKFNESSKIFKKSISEKFKRSEIN